MSWGEGFRVRTNNRSLVLPTSRPPDSTGSPLGLQFSLTELLPLLFWYLVQLGTGCSLLESPALIGTAGNGTSSLCCCRPAWSSCPWQQLTIVSVTDITQTRAVVFSNGPAGLSRFPGQEVDGVCPRCSWGRLK